MTSLESGAMPLVGAPASPATSAHTDNGSAASPSTADAVVKRRWETRAGLALFAGGCVAAVVWLMVLGRGLTFFFDEWNFVDTRGQSFWATDLAPHNGHPVVVSFALYRLLFAVVGIGRYWPYLALVVGVNVLCGWLLFVLLRHRVSPIAAGAAAGVLMLLGPAWQDLLWPFQIGLLGSMAAGLGAVILLDRRRVGTDMGATACLTLAVFCSGVGISVLVGVTVELLWRRSSWHRIWVTLVPGALFGAWYLTKGRGSTPLIHPALSSGAHFVGAAGAGVLAALTGQDSRVGGVLAIVLVVLAAVAIVLNPGGSGRLAMAVTGALSFWVLTLVTRGSSPATSRYLYPGAVFALLAVGELPHLLRDGFARRRRKPAHAVTTRSRTACLVAIGFAVLVVAYSGFAIWRNSSALIAGRRSVLLAVSETVERSSAPCNWQGNTCRLGSRPTPSTCPR